MALFGNYGDGTVGDALNQGKDDAKQHAKEQHEAQLKKKQEEKQANDKLMASPEFAKQKQAMDTELASKFVIVDEDFSGAKAPNMITQGDYEHYVELMCKVQNNMTDLKLDAASDDKAKIMEDLERIIQTDSGRKLIEQLTDNELLDIKTGKQQTDAYGDTIHHTTTLKASKDLTKSETESTKAGDMGKDGKQGKGADSTITYGAGLDHPYEDPVTGSLIPIRSDVALFHELMHSAYTSQGLDDPSLVSKTDEPVEHKDYKLNPWEKFGLAFDEAYLQGKGEEQAMGTGIYAGDFISENAYRKERLELGKGTVGAVAGDEDMPPRLTHMNASKPPG